MRTRRKLLVGVILVLSLTMVSLTGCVFQDGEGVWRSWGPNGDNQNYTGIDCNEYGCFYFRDGVLDWGYNGMACNEYGWWHITNGVVDFNYTGMDCNEYGWWFFRNGQLDWNYTGWAANEYGIWLYVNGRMNFDYNGFYEDFLVENSRAKLEYTGLYGDRYVENGKFNRNFNGVVDGKQVVNGVVTGPVKPEPTPIPEPTPTPEPTPVHTHDFTVKNAQEATCTTNGYSGDKVCLICGEVVKGTVIPKNNNHVHVSYTAPVTETIYHGDPISGCGQYYCTICGELICEACDGVSIEDLLTRHFINKHNFAIHTGEYWAEINDSRELTEEEEEAWNAEIEQYDPYIRKEYIPYWTEEKVISASSYHCNDCGKNSTDGIHWH